VGHIIDREGVAVDPDKVQAMLAWLKPQTLKGLRGFLCLTRYYRKFIQHYSIIARPLTQLLKKDAFVWNEEAKSSFSQLKTAMTQAPVLALPDFSQQFVIECDASGLGIGVQGRQPIAYFSQALHGRNLSLSTYDKEMLALVTSIQKWRPYLLGHQFVVRTDHCSLKYLWDHIIAPLRHNKNGSLNSWEGDGFGERQSHRISFPELTYGECEWCDSRVFEVPLPPKQL